MKKLKEIEQINKPDELNRIVGELLKSMELKDISRKSSNLISAKEISLLEERNLYFACFENELIGKDPIINDIIKEIPEETDSIYIVTPSQKISNYFKNWIEKENISRIFKYWNADNIITNIDKYMPDFWAHKDLLIKPYEIYYEQRLKDDIELRSLLKLDDKYVKLLDMFIEPRLNVYVEDLETDRLIKKSFDKNKFIKNGNYIISGEAGTGKSTLLKEVGKLILNANENSNTTKKIPILLKISDIIYNELNVKKSIETILLKVYQDFELKDLYEKYSIILLIDSIDDLEKSKQIKITNQIEDLVREKNIRYIICTRSYEYFTEDCKLNNPDRVTVENFNIKQIKSFISHFFRFDDIKADLLLQTLQENNILEKIPLTPLTLSVISILYEERQYEIPATITDVYDNFNLFLLGRTSVKSNLEFLDINIKERILSLYALTIIKDANRNRMTRLAFIEFINNFFSSRSITINVDLIPELVNSLTQGTGILMIDELENICFVHDLFMEYYASLEIFKQERESEDTLIERFTDFNWQNTSIFYAGRTKDMPTFLNKLIKRVKMYTNLNDCLIATSGLGYILQALYLTNSQVRKAGVIEALNLLVKADNKVKELSTEKFPFFVGIKEPDIVMMNLMWFFHHFSSITLKDSLLLSFDELYSAEQSFFETDKRTLLFQLFCIALVLSSNKINSIEKLDKLFNQKSILNDPLFLMLFDYAIETVNPTASSKIKAINKVDNKKRKYYLGIKYYLDNSAEDLRFTTWESIKPYKTVEIYTEGKTDAEIIEHAFKVLTNDGEPYWNIRACNNLKQEGAGANELFKFLSSIAPKIDNEIDRKKIVIGIFDNDAKGIREFNLLKDTVFDKINNRIKKHKEQNIYAIRLPIPPDKSYYINEKQDFNFFEIEHYFPIEYLEEKRMLKPTGIGDIFEISGNKSSFTKEIIKESSLNIFKEFKYLLEEIDFICNVKVDYSI